MYQPKNEYKVPAMAGFDLTDMSRVFWREMCEDYNISLEAEKTKDGWIWKSDAGYVVTANNPITGEYYSDFPSRDEIKDYLAYVGIEGELWFVALVFEYIKEMAEYIKNEEFGKRTYI